jgi:hypothetical protein
MPAVRRRCSSSSNTRWVSAAPVAAPSQTTRGAPCSGNVPTRSKVRSNGPVARGRCSTACTSCHCGSAMLPRKRMVRWRFSRSTHLTRPLKPAPESNRLPSRSISFAIATRHGSSRSAAMNSRRVPAQSGGESNLRPYRRSRVGQFTTTSIGGAGCRPREPAAENGGRHAPPASDRYR